MWPQRSSSARARPGCRSTRTRSWPTRSPQLALGQEVPEELWTAVAEVLAWAYGLSDRAQLPRIGDQGHRVQARYRPSPSVRFPSLRSPSAHEAHLDHQPPPRLRGRGARALARVQAHRRPPGPQPPRDDLRAAREVHRLQEGPRAAGSLRGRGLHLLRPRGPDRLDRPLRPGQGRHARAVRVDPHPRRRARRAAPPGLGAALAAPLGARHRQGARAVHRHPRPPPDARGARRLARRSRSRTCAAARTTSRSPTSPRSTRS